jgi:hypothetical protein
MTTETNTTIQPALLFMPDICGFTEFVTSTEITHAQSIIQEVLETIIESNHIGLEVGEIEGDAIFFYRLGKAPSLDQLLKQVQTMFTKFHQYLQLYEKQRICPCEACYAASQLKLKIVAHFGEVTGYAVKSHRKLFGKDVIVLHRLLKNSVNKNEYALLTDPLMEGADTTIQLPDWFEPEGAKEQYDVGEVSFKVSDLAKLKTQVPEVIPQDLNSAKHSEIVFTEEAIFQAPIQRVFGAIYDLSQRSKWMDGVQRIEMVSNDLLHRVGTMHRCVFGNRNNPIIVTEYASIGEGRAELVEMDKKGIAGCRYVAEVINEEQCKLKIDMLVKKNPFILAIFSLFMKRKMQRQLRRSIENLKEYCKPSFLNPQLTVTELN